jgi:DNA-3-methyladenine glycosylase II
MQPIRTEADISAGVTALLKVDPSFAPVVDLAGHIPLRYRPPAYEGLAHIVVGQVVSRASADAIWRRLQSLTEGAIQPDRILARGVEELRAAGLSGAKESTLRGLAEACRNGLDLERIAFLDTEAAIAELTAVKGIGLWTAEVFLLFCAGHPDIFPTGDVALQSAAADAFGLAERPQHKAFRAMALRWQPHRSIAARVLWAYYGVRNGRQGLPVA